MFNLRFLNDLFMPGLGPGRMLRTPNRYKRGFLKRSMWSRTWISANKPHQGEREMARRRRQLERGIIKR